MGPVRGLVPPLDFIPVAEETGYILEIGAWVLNEPCRQLAEWRRIPRLLDDVPIADGVKERAIVIGMVELAHAIGMRVVAEGVETAGQLSELRRIGCDVVQGWYIARPASASEVVELMAPLSVV